MKKKLIPVDPNRCQTEWKGGSFMTLGPRPMIRCKRKPAWVARETVPDPDYEGCGAMSLCEKHRQVLAAQHQKNVEILTLEEWAREERIKWYTRPE